MNDHILTWIIAEAWRLLDDGQEAENWRSYVRQHAPEVLEKWGSVMVPEPAEVPEVPGFEGTREALSKLTIIK